MALSFDKVNKIITVQSPDTEITIQNLLNSIREWEDELTSIDMPVVVSCAGKEPLGGGVVVGLTLTLLDDWQLAFEARSGPTYIQCTVSGGNIVAVHVDGSISPTAFTQVLITASSSATQSDLAAIQYASFGGGVSLDITSSNSGTDYPMGNQEYPVNNLSDAIAIAGTKFNVLFIKTSMIGADKLDGGEDITGFTLMGESKVNTYIEIDSALVCANVSILRSNVYGTLDGGTHIEDCNIGAIEYMNGEMDNCGMYGDVVLGGSENAVIANCRTIDQDNPLNINMGVSGQSLAIPGFSGLITVSNLNSATDEIGIGLDHGMVILNSSITQASAVIISGIGMLIDNTPDTVTVNSSGLLNTSTISTAVSIAYSGKVYIDIINGTSGTTAPQGTEKYPVNTLADALVIAAREEIKVIDILGTLTITTGQDVSNYTVMADRSLGNSVIVNSGTITTGTYFENLTVSGIMNGSVRYTTCVLGHIENFNGGAKNCLLTDHIHFTGTGNNYLTECDTYVTSSAYISLYQNNASLNIIRGRGRWGIIDKTSTNVTAIDLVSGYVYVDSTCNVGEIHVGGIGSVQDDSSAGCTVSQGALNNEYIANAVWDVDLTDHNIAESTGSAANDVSYTDKFIFIDTDLVVNGNGKSNSPFNNVSDAVDFAELVGWRKLIALSNITLERTMKNFTIEGIGLPTIDFAGQDVDKSVFLTLKLTGQQVGSVTAREVVLLPGISDLNGIYKECAVVAGGTYNIVENGIVSLTTISVFPSGVTPATPVFDLGAATTNAIFSIRKYSGSAQVSNVNTATKLASLEFDSGKITIDSTCTNGSIRIVNLLEDSITDNSNGSTVSLVNVAPSAESIWGYER